MSRWLSSVGNLLENLDDQVQNVREVVGDVLTERRDSDDEYYTSEEEEDDDDDDEEEEEEDEEEEIDLVAQDDKEPGKLFPESPGKEAPQFEAVDADTEVVPTTATTESSESIEKPNQVLIKNQPQSQVSSAKKQPRESSANKPSATEAVGSAVPSDSVGGQKGTSDSKTKPAQNISRPQPPPGAAAGNAKDPIHKKSEGADKTQPSAIASPAANIPIKAKQHPQPPSDATRPSPQAKISSASTASAPKPGQKTGGVPAPQATPTAAATAPQKQLHSQGQQQKRMQPPPPPKVAPVGIKKPPSSAGAASSSSNSNKQQVLAEMRQLRKQVYTLQQELLAANKEIKAQQKELDSAATIVERERQELKEEKEDMQEDHEEEIENLKAEYEDKVAKLKSKYKQQVDDMKEKLSQEKAERQQEGGDLSQDLKDALERERNALQAVASLQTEKANSEAKIQNLTSHQEALQERLETLVSSQNSALLRQQEAER